MSSHFYHIKTSGFRINADDGSDVDDGDIGGDTEKSAEIAKKGTKSRPGSIDLIRYGGLLCRSVIKL